MKVLVVEGDPVARRQMQASLQHGGLEVMYAADGESAWQILQAPDAPRLVVLDRVMPGMDGQGLLRRLRADAARPHVHVIMVVTGGVHEQAETHLDAGADDYLRRPVDAAELRARVRSAARSLRRAQSLEQGLATARRAIASATNVLSLCLTCRRLQTDTGEWEALESALERLGSAHLAPAECPECREARRDLRAAA